MKKKIIVGCFIGLILLTAIFFLAVAIKSYQYDMDPQNGVDVFEGVAAFLCVVIGAFVILYELDLFYTIYYFFVKPKTPFKTVLNLLSNCCYLLVFAYSGLSYIYMEMRVYEITALILFALYVILRSIYWIGAAFMMDAS